MTSVLKVREIQEPVPEQLPPLVIYKKAPRPDTPPPLVIRERPPSPPYRHATEPLIIERRVAAREPMPRKIIVEHLPAPPAKPRDIILEKWLAKEVPPRTVYYQRAYKNLAAQGVYHKPQVYEMIDYRNTSNSIKDTDVYRRAGGGREVYERQGGAYKSKQRRSPSNEYIYASPTGSSQIYAQVNSLRGQNQADSIYYDGATMTAGSRGREEMNTKVSLVFMSFVDYK